MDDIIFHKFCSNQIRKEFSRTQRLIDFCTFDKNNLPNYKKILICSVDKVNYTQISSSNMRISFDPLDIKEYLKESTWPINYGDSFGQTIFYESLLDDDKYIINFRNLEKCTENDALYIIARELGKFNYLEKHKPNIKTPNFKNEILQQGKLFADKIDLKPKALKSCDSFEPEDIILKKEKIQWTLL